MTSELNIKPEDLLLIMSIESGLNPAAHNPNGHASGLVQFMPSTLKALGFQGSASDFRSLPAEHQLDYVKALIKNMMHVNGGPFTSAAQYYVGNFIPVALKLPGIKAGDPKTIIVSKNAIAPHLPGVSAATERSWYNANPGLDFDKDGNITYGDIQAVVDRGSRTSSYQKALEQLHAATGYLAKHPAKSVKKVNLPSMAPSNIEQDIDSILTQYLKSVASVQKKSYRKLLPLNHIVIQIQAKQHEDAVEFARLLSLATQEELLCRASIHCDDNIIEVQCDIHGPTSACMDTIKQLTSSLHDNFYQVVNKTIKTNVINKKSSLMLLTPKIACQMYDKFHLKISQGKS